MRSLSISKVTLSLLLLLSGLLCSPQCYSAPPPGPPHLTVVRSWVGRQEVGHNRGAFVDMLNKHAGNRIGDPYCAAAVGTALDMAGAKTPIYRGGWAQGYREPGSFSARDVIRGRVLLLPGDIPIWQQGETAKGHTGVIERVIDSRTFVSIEANTSPGAEGSQDDGDGVWRKVRSISLTNFFKPRWFTRPTYGCG